MLETSFEIVKKDNKIFKKAYNLFFPISISDPLIELECARRNHPINQGGLGAYKHFLNTRDLFFPELIKSHNEWSRDRFKAFLSPTETIVLAGAASTGKSQDTALFALLWWLMNPSERTVIAASTTLDALKKRLWSYIVEFHSKIPELPKLVSNSLPPKILWKREDPKHGIFGLALKEGNSDRSIAGIIGIHPKEGMLLVLDECTDITPAILDALTNIRQGVAEFKLIGIGNSKSRLDTHGQLCEPLAGWSSINPDFDTEWKTKKGGICLYFDAYKSPGIVHPELSKKGKPLAFLWNEEKIATEKTTLGEEHPLFWRFVRGFWAPEDASKSVLTMTLAEKHRILEPAKWAGQWRVPLVACDPAFTEDGDEAIIRKGFLGVDISGNIVLETVEILRIPLSANDPDPISYQIANYCISYCKKHNIQPHHFVIDTNTAGAGVADIIGKLWNNDIFRLSSAGMPTKRPSSDSTLGETNRDIFDRRASEVYFNVRNYVVSNQIKNIDLESLQEFCDRQYEFKGRKICIERKKEYKKRMGHERSAVGSPDRSDTLALMCDLVLEMGYPPGSRDATPAWLLEYEGTFNQIIQNKGDDEALEIGYFDSSFDFDPMTD